MKLDIKQKFLTAMYLEYQKDDPNYKENVTPEKLHISKEQFQSALSKLDNEELIGHDAMFGLFGVSDTNKPTLKGIEFIEKLFRIESSDIGVTKMCCIGEELENDGNHNELLGYIRQAMIEQDPFYQEYFKECSSFSKYSVSSYKNPFFSRSEG